MQCLDEACGAGLNLILTLEPAFTAAIAYLVLSEHLNGIQITGSLPHSGRRRLSETLREPAQHPDANHTVNQEHGGKHAGGMI